ncbi:MAG: T9SS type A sorting domain-containing protein, partial [candidate division WOR-3 bacterium]|nr:T9SS type A sorting domain-containing protein [candidate division WOR-3 bacterium]
GSSFTIRLKNEALNEIVTLRIYNVLGHLVYSEKTNKGFFTVTELPSGIYILRIEAKGYTETGRVIVVK